MAKNSNRLTAKQQLAINAILAGATDTDAAKAAGVHRMTISDWRQNNPLFIQELNSLLNEARRKAVEPYNKKLDELIDDSFSTLSYAIKRNDIVTARWLLDKVNVFPSMITDKFNGNYQFPEPLPDDIDAIIENIAERTVKEVMKECGKSDFDILADKETVSRLKHEVANTIKNQYQKEEQ